ncbi:Na+/H+ antiporter NhaA [Rubrivirga sp. S365]|uniref:Na(+)/H(+) antiporter NhaA n=1 Tax=Rubrivirga litoralis TaxID=3075598 RepID=A0ABU3BT93_9BACT|nr:MULTISPECIES: Na+/H+ antiporter NhaA [unclassified Rubrivirga]MDT0632500.1 Na+/H+ antiporter NhaA [Rubrivirga sp. F394]MDT7858000.1 Na+/H+ antiporter NhaA [Rubrivirga sp. S365]
MQTLLRPFQTFFKTEAAGGVLLLVAAAAALVWANSPFAGVYADLWGTYVTVGAGAFEISKPLLLWINDGLMAIFFFVVGLEIKREVLAGELSEPRKAALAIAAALGGMVVPAVLYTVANLGTDRLDGWGIPMATDIAFALGVLALLGSRAPLALKVFLTAVAIVDDLGAVIVIAVFYTAQINVSALLWSLALVGLLAVVNRLGVQRTAVYAIVGVAAWVFMLKSGVHATIAGVLVALTIPANRKIHEVEFADRVTGLLARFREGIAGSPTDPTPEQAAAVHSIEVACQKVETPLARLEHGLHGFVAFFIMPVFALANAGVALGADAAALVTDTVALGVMLGLVVGKPIGVMGMAFVAVKTGLAALPTGVTWRHVLGVSFLTGIGFTMSIFIANLAFGPGPLLDSAKTGILAASVISGALGAVVLSRAAAAPPTVEEERPLEAVGA